MLQYRVDNTDIKDFYYDGEPLLMPVGTKFVHDGKVWGLYVNYDLDMTFIVTKGLLNGKYGWRIRAIPGIMNLSYAEGYVKQRCGSCFEKQFGVSM
jgi:hypothetical protein